MAESMTLSQGKLKLNIDNVKPDTISKPFAVFVLVLGTVLAALIVILNIVITQPLFIQGLNFIHSYQSLQPAPAIRVIQNLISLICNPIGVGVIMGLYYIITNRKLLVIVHLSYFLFSTYIIAILKQALKQSRPLWYDSRIQNWEWFCPKDFGNPSGHSFAVILLFQPIFSDALGYWKFRPWGFVLAILCILMPISRMYLGVHSANQTLFGISFGFTFLILYKYIYQRALYQLFWQFLTGIKQKLKFLAVFLLMSFVIVIPIIFYQVNKAQRPMLFKDITNLNKQCNTHLTGEQVQGSMLVSCSIGCVFFGLILGFICLANRPGYRSYLLGKWTYQSNKMILLKLVVYIVCGGLPFLVFFLISQFALKGIPYGQYFLTCAAITAGGFGLSFLAPMLTAKWGIMKLQNLDNDRLEHPEQFANKQNENK